MLFDLVTDVGNLIHAPGHGLMINRLTLNLHSLFDMNQVRRSVQTSAESSRLQHAGNHGSSRTFALGAGHMDDAIGFMGVAQQLEHELHAVELQRTHILGHADLFVIDPGIPEGDGLFVGFNLHEEEYSGC